MKKFKFVQKSLIGILNKSMYSFFLSTQPKNSNIGYPEKYEEILRNFKLKAKQSKTKSFENCSNRSKIQIGIIF